MINPETKEIFPNAREPHPKEACPTFPPSIPPASDVCGPAIVLKPIATEPSPEALL